MWKTLSRGFRETFERGLGFTLNNNPRVHNETQTTKYYQCSKPTCFIERYINKKGCQQGYKDNERAKEERKSYGTYDPFDSWLGAVSCSSAIALGWVLSHPCPWKKWFFKSGAEERHQQRTSLVECLAKIAVSQPILPSVPTQDRLENKVEYGPLTPEEALNEAADNFLKVHNSIFGEVENKQAVSLIEGPKKDERKAIKLFYSASKKGYVPASYNLGQCYELGIGTKQDFCEAAKWYQKAAEAGHPTATYNLAVFYAHGWGGLKSDVHKARQLLKIAASLGQPDAAAALGLNKGKTPSQPLPVIPKEIVKTGSPNPPLDVSSDPDELYRLATSFENSPCDDATQPHLVLQLYKMASDLGHKEAKSKYKILQAYETVGLLTEYLCRGSKPTSDAYSRMRFPTVF